MNIRHSDVLSAMGGEGKRGVRGPFQGRGSVATRLVAVASTRGRRSVSGQHRM